MEENIISKTDHRLLIFLNNSPQPGHFVSTFGTGVFTVKIRTRFRPNIEIYHTLVIPMTPNVAPLVASLIPYRSVVGLSSIGLEMNSAIWADFSAALAFSSRSPSSTA